MWASIKAFFTGLFKSEEQKLKDAVAALEAKAKTQAATEAAKLAKKV